MVATQWTGRGSGGSPAFYQANPDSPFSRAGRASLQFEKTLQIPILQTDLPTRFYDTAQVMERLHHTPSHPKKTLPGRFTYCKDANLNPVAADPPDNRPALSQFAR